MPLLTIYCNGKSLTQSNEQALAKELSLITHKCLAKNIEHTVINYVSFNHSYINGGMENDSNLSLEIKITAGTNTDVEKSNWINNVWDTLQTHFPSDVLVGAVGQDSVSPALQQLFSELKIGEKNLEKYPLNLAGQRLWWNEAKRLQLEFKNNWLLKDVPSDNVNKGPWVLTALIFWGADKKNGVYAGPIPYDLDFSMARDSIRNMMLNIGLGEATVLGFSEDVDMWLTEGLEITVEYSEDHDAIRCISIGVPIDRSSD